MSNDTAGWIASTDGRIFFVGLTREVVEEAAHATAAPLSRQSMNTLDEHVNRMMARGKDFVLLDGVTIKTS